jgi:hypothetical protein
MSNPYQSRVAAIALACAGLVALSLQSAAFATPFNLVNMTSVSPPPPGIGIHGIAQVGSEWFMANFSSGWNVYDASFNQIGTTTTNTPTGETRALVYNSNSGNMFIGEYSGGVGIIHEVTTGGTVLNSFSSTGTSLNALAFNPVNSHLFALHFTGLVVELTTAGAVVNSFTAAGTWTGAAFDAVNNTLLLLNSSPDQVLEYTPAGVFVDTPLAGDAVNGNGQGLHYDSSAGLLHVTGQFGDIGIWHRTVSPVSIAEESWGSIKAKYRDGS